MDTPYSKDQKATALAQLPEPIRDAILSLDMAEKFRTIMDKYDLRIDATQDIAEATFLVLVGLAQPPALVKEVRKNTTLSEEQATQLMQDLNKDIFGPIRGHVLNPQHKEPPVASSQESNTAPPTKMLESKLTGTVHAPLEPSSRLQTPPAPDHPYTEGDPYREPIE